MCDGVPLPRSASSSFENADGRRCLRNAAHFIQCGLAVTDRASGTAGAAHCTVERCYRTTCRNGIARNTSAHARRHHDRHGRYDAARSSCRPERRPKRLARNRCSGRHSGGEADLASASYLGSSRDGASGHPASGRLANCHHANDRHANDRHARHSGSAASIHGSASDCCLPIPRGPA